MFEKCQASKSVGSSVCKGADAMHSGIEKTHGGSNRGHKARARINIGCEISDAEATEFLGLVLSWKDATIVVLKGGRLTGKNLIIP